MTRRTITTFIAVAMMIIAASVASRAQSATGIEHTPCSAQRTMVVAWSNNGYLVTENGGASWRVVLAKDADQLPPNLVRLMKAARTRTTAERTVVAPNPTSGSVEFRVTVEEPGRMMLSLADMRGAEALRIPIEAQSAGVVSQSVDLSSLPGGVYYYRITNGEGPVGSGVLTLVR